MTRTAFVVTSLHGGGAEAVGRAWMGWLAQRGHEVTALTTSAKATDQHLPPGVALRSVAEEGNHVERVRSLRRALAGVGADAVVALQTYPNLLAVAAVRSMGRSRPAVLVSERNLVSLGLRGASPGHRAKVGMARLAYGRADRVIAISHPVAAELVAAFGVRGERCVVVPNPAAEKAAGRSPREELPGEANGSSWDVEVVLAHRLVSQKRPQLAVAAAAELGRRGRSVRLTVFGDGPLRADVERSAASSGVDLDMRGWLEDWHLHCSPRAVQLLASSREGFGNVLVEAAAVGVPSVAVSGALGVADAVVPGITGVLSIDDSPAALADALEQAAGLRLDPALVRPWLDRFSLRSSGLALEHALEGALAEVPRSG